MLFSFNFFSEATTVHKREKVIKRRSPKETKDLQASKNMGVMRNSSNVPKNISD
jgi:hypothetical protein